MIGGMTNEEMKEHCTKLFPTLKRWKCTCTDECASGYNPNCTCENPQCHCKEKTMAIKKGNTMGKM